MNLKLNCSLAGLVREQRPVIHCITNYVTAADVANAILACGGSPIMADHPEEAAEVTAISDCLLLNTGTPKETSKAAMEKAGREANRLNHPVILDPVGIGVSRYRTEAILSLLKEVKMTVIRGNASELRIMLNAINRLDDTENNPAPYTRGMAGTSRSIETIGEKLEAYARCPIVVDPVMVSTSGHSLLNSEDVKALTNTLFPLAALVTPNIPEAESLLSTRGRRIHTRKNMEEAAIELSHLYKTSFLVKGGHHDEGADDVLCSGGSITWFPGQRIDNPNTHGTGCTLSSAIACGLAKGLGLEESIHAAKDYLKGALKAGLNLGKGSGPLWHSWSNTR